jgi:transglutaminase-like putative cysteine protease
MRFRVDHVTRYRYPDPVSLCHSVAHLKPREQPGQRVLRSQIRVDPWPSVSRQHTDFFGNKVSYFSVQQSHDRLEVRTVSEVDVVPAAMPDLADSPPWEQVVEQLREGKSEDLVAARIFTLPSALVPASPAMATYACAAFTPGRPVLAGAADLMGRIFRDFEYDPHFTTIATPLDQVLDHRRGVCQDFAHVGLAGVRALGLAGRYVSGYLETLPPPGQPKLKGADASHAWFSLYVPGLGWVDLDPTNDQVPREQHITVAVGRDFQDVTPLRGVFYGGGAHELEVEVDVERLARASP